MGFLLVIFLLIQIIILKKDFSPIQVLQLGLTFIYGFSVDLVTYILSFFPNNALWQQVIYCALGIVILALGVFTMLKTQFFMLPQDAVVGVISDRYNKEYGKVKIALDSVLTTIAAIGSLMLNHRLVHVGIGTIAPAIFVGKIISKLKGFNKLNRLIDRMITTEIRKENQDGSSESHFFVTPKNEY